MDSSGASPLDTTAPVDVCSCCAAYVVGWNKGKDGIVLLAASSTGPRTVQSMGMSRGQRLSTTECHASPPKHRERQGCPTCSQADLVCADSRYVSVHRSHYARLSPRRNVWLHGIARVTESEQHLRTAA